MLRRKLFRVFGPLVVLLLATAVAAIILLQSVLTSLNHINTELSVGSQIRAALVVRAASVEQHLHDPEILRAEGMGHVSQDIERLGDEFALLDHELFINGAGGPIRTRIRELIPKLREVVLISGPDLADDMDATEQRTQAWLIAVELQTEIASLSDAMQQHNIDEQRSAFVRLRWIILGLTLAFIVLINISIMLLLRVSRMILDPVEQLVEASQRLGREEYDLELPTDGIDEFADIAHSLDDLAQQLRQNEQQKIDTLQHVARALNHELNNAMHNLELQLELISRKSEGTPEFAEPLRRIRDTLGRMSGTIGALGRARRIVLTDYISGLQMLDIKGSSEDTVCEPSVKKITLVEPKART